MAKDPAFLFYTSDFLTGTTFMNNEEVGKYIRTLCLLHQHGGRLPKEKIETVVGNLSITILEKLEADKDGNLFNKRLLIETQKRNAFCESRRTNIKHRYEATSVEHMNKHMENENEDVNKDKDVNKVKDCNKGGVGGKKKDKVKDRYLDFVLLTKEEHQKLVAEFGEAGAEERIKRLNNYGHTNPKKFKDYGSHYRVILVWAERDNLPERAGVGWGEKGGRL